MLSFGDFWNNAGSAAGDYSYGLIHILSMILTVLITALLCFWGLKNKKVQRKLILVVAYFQLSFEIIWRIIWICKGDPLIVLYPFYPCNINGILIPLAAIINNQTMKKMFYFFGFVGAILTFAIPNGIFNDKFLTLPILKSILQHTGLFLLPVMEFVFKKYRPKFKQIGWMFLGIFICVFNAEVMPLIFGQTGYDYMFFRSDLPFVIPGVPQWITLSVFGFVIFTLLYASIDFKGFLSFFKKDKKNNNKTEI